MGFRETSGLVASDHSAYPQCCGLDSSTVPRQWPSKHRVRAVEWKISTSHEIAVHEKQTTDNIEHLDEPMTMQYMRVVHFLPY